jgi:hypothetical protein
MPIESIVVVSLIAFAFGIFAVALAWANIRTGDLMK